MDLGLANVAQAASLELLELSPKVHLGFACGATATVLLVCRECALGAAWGLLTSLLLPGDGKAKCFAAKIRDSIYGTPSRSYPLGGALPGNRGLERRSGSLERSRGVPGGSFPSCRPRNTGLLIGCSIQLGN